MPSNLCEYKELLGRPGEGVHKYRMFGLGIIDVIVPLLVAYLIHYYFGLELWKVVVGIFVLGVIVHRLFCVRTAVDKLLFP